MQPADLEQIVGGQPAHGLVGLGLLRCGVGGTEQAVNAGIGPSFSVTQQLGPGRSEPGAAVQVGHFAHVPGIVGRRHIASPGRSIR
jgi:hypothetical protein